MVIARTNLIDFRNSHIYFLFDRVVLERRQFNTVEIRKWLVRPLPLQQACAMHVNRIPKALAFARTDFAILENPISWDLNTHTDSVGLHDFSGMLART